MQRTRRTRQGPRATPRRAQDSLAAIAADIVACARCPRLRRHCLAVARAKRRAYRDEDYWGRPVPAFGAAGARLWILGLAPAAHGANRTGRMFTGDASGDWLFGALHATGFARLPHSRRRDDGQSLHDAYISAVVRCAPPLNKPSRREIETCAGYLRRELDALPRLRVLLCLGQIAFTAALRLLETRGYALPRPRPRFGHAAEHVLARPAAAEVGTLVLLASYHPSRQNTQTGRLTRPMWEAVFRRARALLDAEA
jgi:uracil-DNA glycosylase family 4